MDIFDIGDGTSINKDNVLAVKTHLTVVFIMKEGLIETKMPVDKYNQLMGIKDNGQPVNNNKEIHYREALTELRKLSSRLMLSCEEGTGYYRLKAICDLIDTLATEYDNNQDNMMQNIFRLLEEAEDE